MLKKLLFWAALSLACFLIFAEINRGVYISTAKKGFGHFPKNNNISPQMALELANPFLEYSYNLRKKNRSEKYNKPAPPIDRMVLKGKFYYVTRDSYNSRNANFYIPYAVKINKNNGKIIKPSVMAKYNSWWQQLLSDLFY